MTSKAIVICLLWLSLVISTKSASFSDSTTAISDVVALTWESDDEEFCVTMSNAKDVEDSGWVGFGLAEPSSGGMKGADIVVASVDSSGAWTVGDYFVEDEQASPTVDCKQNWRIRSTAFSARVSYEVTLCRDLDTKDTEDRKIPSQSEIASGVSPSLRVIVAYGKGGLGYHSNKREAIQISLSSSTTKSIFQSLRDDPDVIYLELRHNNSITSHEDIGHDGFKVPTQETTYMDFEYEADLILNITGKMHIVGIEPILEAESKEYVHHFVLSVQKSYKNIYAWARGSDGLVLPDAAGFPVYPGEKFYLNTHFDNPTGNANVVDNSGVRVWFKKTPRAHDAGLLQLGDPTVRKIGLILPQGKSSITFTCSAACTSKKLTHDISIFGSMLHMHGNGIGMMNVHRDSQGQVVAQNLPWMRSDYYDWEFQPFLDDVFTISANDSISTTCIYDTRGSSVTFGLASENEMCITFLAYYPLVPDFGSCTDMCEGSTLPDAESISGFEKAFPQPAASTTCDEINGSPRTKRLLSFICTLVLFLTTI